MLLMSETMVVRTNDDAEGYFVIFFFQAEVGIRDVAVTGVQTCALPIYLDARLMCLGPAHPNGQTSANVLPLGQARTHERGGRERLGEDGNAQARLRPAAKSLERSEERRVGKEGRSRWSPYH